MLRFLLLPLLLSACGGGGPDIISASQAAAPPTPVVHQLHAIVRPAANGQWFVQNDVDHSPSGISSVTQTGEYLEVVFDRSYSHAGSIQVSMDDDFNGFCTAGTNLGLSATRVRIKCNGTQINPTNIYSYAPITPGSGNLWINVTMVQK